MRGLLMGVTRRLPESQTRILERLARDNWRQQVATGTAGVNGAVQGDGQDSPTGVQATDLGGDAFQALLARVNELEQRMDLLEGVENSG